MTKGKVPVQKNLYDRFFSNNDPHRTLVDQLDADKYIVGRAPASALETDFVWQIWVLEMVGTVSQITYASDGEPRFRWVDRELVTDPNLPDDGSPAGIFTTKNFVDAGDPAGTTVGFLYPEAKDVGTESYVFAIVGDPSNKFALSPTTNNQLVLTDEADGTDDFYLVDIMVVDSQNRTFQETLTINVANIRLTNTKVEESVPLGTKIADIIDVGGVAPTVFAITNDPDQKFQVSGGDLITRDAMDFSVKEEHLVTISSTDSLSVVRSETFVIEVLAETQGLLASVITENDDGDSALRVLVSNNENEPVPVKLSGDGLMRCEKGVFNLIAGVPFEILASNLDEICDATFYKDNGERIFIQYRNLADRIIVCSKKTMLNLEFRIEGPVKCPI